MDSLGAKARGLLVCFSHLPWDLVFQRPQHLLIRAAREYDVIYVEEPRRLPVAAPALGDRREGGVTIVTPELPEGSADVDEITRSLLQRRLAQRAARTETIAWFYTPMALGYAGWMEADICVYDCMDELSGFKDPPPGLIEREAELFERADLVFTGGISLYEAKRQRHPRVFAFPSSVDTAHFARAEGGLTDPADQAGIPRPRIGFFGVVDERMDLGLVAHAASACPEIQFVMLGPVVKIDPASLPRAPNLHWLGRKPYEDLPTYLGNWDAGWMPFTLNEATRFISPTKTPEFLAAGLPLVSTAVADVVRGYGANGLVAIADRGNLANRLRAALAPPEAAWRAQVSAHLAAMSWDRTWAEMKAHVERLLGQRVPLARKGA
jgi:glycosyltransferase involved in cell wall biosynthesis